jgi:hypothetical protein
VSIQPTTLRAALDEDQALRSLVQELDGLFWVHGIRSPPLSRRARIERACALARRARRVARIIRHAPFVRGVALTGSVAAADADLNADVDFLVIAAPQRLATTFLLLGGLSRMVGRRVLCPNYYISADAIPSGSCSQYITREMAQARLLVGDRAEWLRATSWVREWFPNLDETSFRDDEPMRGGGWVQRFVERALRGSLGDRLERRAARVALERLRVHHGHYGEEPPVAVVEKLRDGAELRFHAGGLAESVTEQYSAIRERVLAALRQLTAA